MRLHHLRVTAFGPFAGTVEVDFDAVGQAGLFLIQGPTGAGKTSLLDAICFALYAAVPGVRPGGQALRSDHAARDVVPSVSVDFTTGARRFRVTRSPEFMRPKKRGDGETRTQAAVVLEEHLGGRWAARSTRADEVGEIITEILAMGLEQFSKVVLLPQGEFAAFLRATADERRALLERLFDISTFAGVEAWLVEQRRLRAADVAELRALLTTDLARLEDVIAQAPPHVLKALPEWSAVTLDALPGALVQVRARLAADASDALTALDAADATVGAAEQARADAERTADRQRRGRAARDELARLDADKEILERQAGRLDAALRAQVVAGDLRALERIRGRAELLAAELATFRTRLSDVRVSDWKVAAVQGWVASLTEHGAHLAEAARAARGLTEARRRSAELAVQLGAARSTLDEHIGQATAQQCRHAESVAALGRATAALGDVEVAQREVERLARLQLLRSELEQATAEAERIADLVRGARDREQGAREVYQRLQQARLDGMAGELANTLVDGEACAVCGALDHPRPAPGGVLVTAEDVIAAEAHWQQRRVETMGHVESLVAQQQVVATRTSDLAGVDVRLTSEALAGAIARCTDAQRQAAGLAEAAAASEQAEREHERLVGVVRTVTTQVAALEAALGELTVQERRLSAEVGELLDAHTTSCPCAPAGDPAVPRAGSSGSGFAQLTQRGPAATDDSSLGDVQSRHARVLAEAVALLTLLGAQTDLAEDHARTEAVARDSLSTNGFNDADEARSAALPADDLRELRRIVRAVDDRRAAAGATLADEGVMAALALQPVDVAALEDVAHRARSGLRVAQQIQTRAESTARAFKQLADVLSDQVRTLGPAAAEAEQLADLADTVVGLGGNNTLRMRLSSFVLAARLEKVAVLANERLAIMGDGRYQLQHSDELARGGRRSGLGLLVRDQWTGQVRDTSSLSGGESFMASLALALGLADAVREEAGGFDLQTLFIDEGFGTLDDESLEQVLAVLDGLRDGGRAVGVVSHVSDLRTRIPVQISVSKRATGSTVRVIGIAHG